MSLLITHDKNKNYLFLSNEAVLLHCSQYNTSLQETILLPDYIDGYTIQFQAAAETAKSLLSSSMDDNSEGVAIFTQSDQFFRKMGMGNIDFSNITENGGKVIVPEYHFDLANKQENVANSPTTFVFAAGFIAGTLNFAYRKNFSVRVKSLERPFQFECYIEEGEEISTNNYLNDSSQKNPDDNPAKFIEIMEGIQKDLPKENEHGIIEEKGKLLSYLPASYYNKISYRFEKEMEITAGFEGIAEPLLLESAQIGGFHVLSWITETAVWKAQISGNITNNGDYITAFFSAINALGWGYWLLDELKDSPDFSFRVYQSPESVGYKQEFGKSDLAKCYRITGTTNVICNLAHYGNLQNNPVINENFYQQLFSSDNLYQSTEIQCLVQDASFCEFKVFK